MQKFTRIFIFSLVFLYFSNIQASIIYVKHNASGLNNGSSWANAYTTLQAAIDGASYSGDEIWVAAGTYLPTKDQTGSVPMDSRKKTFRIYKSLSFYGGFEGDETTLSERNSDINAVILSGNLGLSSVYHVLHITSLSGVTLDGFTISGGIADGASSDQYGGGIYLSNASSVTLKNLKIEDNEAVSGGGIYNASTTSITLENVRFCENTAQKGAGMYNDNTNSVIVGSCTFCNNIATENGGGVFNKSLSSLTIVNSLFHNNETDGNGGGIYNHSISSLNITNCTFFQNTADGNGGGFYIVSSSACSFYNSILWNNTDQSGSTTASAQAYANGSTSAKSAYHTLIKGSNGSGGGWASVFSDGGNNLDSDPLLYDPNGTDNTFCTNDDNFGLQAGSPALNAGTNAAPGITSNDIQGESRVQDGTVDLGPFEGVAGAGLPVEWIFVNAEWASSASGRVANIQWGTAQEINNDYFVVERSLKNVSTENWVEIGRVEGSGTSDKTTVYSLEDKNIPSTTDGLVFSYRIRQIDIDGKFSFSHTVELTFLSEDQVSFGAFPNPATDQLTLLAAVEGEQKLQTVRILSINGQTVYETTLDNNKWEQTIGISHLPEGMYFAQLVYSYGQKSLRLMIR